jgi:hypothetical protein
MRIVVHKDGPVKVVWATAQPDTYRAECEDCKWVGPHRASRLDAEDDFDAHQH